MQIHETRRTLSFPFDFSPHGLPCGFGDSNHWQPLPFHYAAAVRFGDERVLAFLDARQTSRFSAEGWPDAAELLVFHPRRRLRAAPAERPVARLYQPMGWGVLADRLPEPRLYLAMRGGTTDVSHSHLDLLSFFCAVDGELLIPNLGVGEYLDTTFGPRRFDLFETTPASKNTILINGVGVVLRSAAAAELVEIGRRRGIRLDASAAMGAMRDGPAATFCGRLFLLLGDRAALIVDRVELPYPGRVESRVHTTGRVRLGPRAAAVETAVTASTTIAGRHRRLHLAYACDVPAALHTAVDALTSPPAPPAPAPTVLRWCTRGRSHTAVTMVTLLTPGDSLASVTLAERRGALTIAAQSKSWRERLRLSPRLRPASP